MTTAVRYTARKVIRALLIAMSIALPLAGARAATPPLTKGVYGGVITVGRGAAGIRLGMTRSQVIARLGRPFLENPRGYMQYAYNPPGKVKPGVEHGLFDLYLSGKRVRMLVIGPHSGWRLPDGNRIFARGGVARLMRRYGRRLRPTRIEDGESLYRITDRYLGRTVWTEFYVERFGPNGSVYGIDMLLR